MSSVGKGEPTVGGRWPLRTSEGRRGGATCRALAWFGFFWLGERLDAVWLGAAGGPAGLRTTRSPQPPEVRSHALRSSPSWASRKDRSSARNSGLSTGALASTRLERFLSWATGPNAAYETTTAAHTGVDIPLYATGRGHQSIPRGTIDNTQIFHIMKKNLPGLK